MQMGIQAHFVLIKEKRATITFYMILVDTPVIMRKQAFIQELFFTKSFFTMVHPSRPSNNRHTS